MTAAICLHLAICFNELRSASMNGARQRDRVRRSMMTTATPDDDSHASFEAQRLI
jgi:hypothetical protein